MLALLLLARPQPLPSMPPIDASDMKEARRVVAEELRVVKRPRRQSTVLMIRDLEHKAWCHRYELMLDGLPLTPSHRPQSARAPQMHDDAVALLDDEAFVQLIERERLDDIHDRQACAAGMATFAAALRIARAERRLPNPPAASTSPSSLLSSPRLSATAFA